MIEFETLLRDVHSRENSSDAFVTGRWTALHPISPRHYTDLVDIASHPLVADTWRLQGSTAQPDKVVALLYSDSTFVARVTPRDNASNTVGLFQLFRTDYRNRHAHIAAFLAPDVQKAGWAVEALAIGIDHAFSRWDFRKLYIETSSPKDMGYHRYGTLFREEGRLADHEYRDGKYCDQVTFAIYQGPWVEWRAQQAERLRLGVDHGSLP